ncbi:MAG TPA: methyltransferase, partial [Rhodocyclaceae bacterium]|nr:methyltransferase [Rhodocyclaceae bacterium]
MSHPPGFDARRFKALERSGFNRIAARYADGAPLRADLQDALLAAAALAPGESVLDLAAGP